MIVVLSVKMSPKHYVICIWYCPRVQLFINSIKINLTRQYQFSLGIQIKKAWFFLTNLNAIEQLLVTLAKIVIYEARFKETQPSVTHFMNKLKCEAETEYNATRVNNKQDIFQRKWGPLNQIHIQENL